MGCHRWLRSSPLKLTDGMRSSPLRSGLRLKWRSITW